MKKNKIYALALILLLVACGAAPNPADEFKKTAFYTSQGFFDDAFISGQGSLVIETSSLFAALKPADRERVSKDAVSAWKRIAGEDGRQVLVEIREKSVKSTLWESNGTGQAIILEQWGPSIVPETGRNVFMSAALTAGSSQGAVISGTFGTYFYKNILDSALNLSVANGSGSIGLSGRAHYLIDPRWDLNGGIGLNLTGQSFNLTFILGASNYLSYRSSLDFNASVSTSGNIMIGSGVTYYLDNISDIGSKFAPGPKEQPRNTPQPAITLAVTPAPSDTPKATPTIELTATPQPINTEVPTSTEVKHAMVQENTPTQEATKNQAAIAVATAEQASAEWISSSINEVTPASISTKIPATQVPTETAVPHATQGRTEIQTYETTPEPVSTREAATPEAQPTAQRAEATKEAEQATGGNTKEGTTAGMFIESDVLNLALSIPDRWMNINVVLGYGDDNLVGMTLVPGFISYERGGPVEYDIFSLNFAIDLYPFGRSPSGLYLGPVGGVRYYLFDPKGINSTEIRFLYGGQAGIRLLANSFVLDAAVIYMRNESSMPGWPEDMTRDLKARACLGFMFYDSPDEDGEKPAGEENSGKRTKQGTTEGTFFELDAMSAYRMYHNDDWEFGCKLGFGDDGNLGMAFMLDGIYNKKETYQDYQLNLKMALDFYPGGRSPSRLYLGPLVGVGGNINRQLIGMDYQTSSNLILTAGGESGIRVLMNMFVIDIGAEYDVHMLKSKTLNDMQREFILHAGVGLMFYDDKKAE